MTKFKLDSLNSEKIYDSLNPEKTAKKIFYYLNKNKNCQIKKIKLININSKKEFNYILATNKKIKEINKIINQQNTLTTQQNTLNQTGGFNIKEMTNNEINNFDDFIKLYKNQEYKNNIIKYNSKFNLV